MRKKGETQLQFVRRQLIENGSVGAHELNYNHGITRAAAIIHTLRKEYHMDIETIERPGMMAIYKLKKPRPHLTLGEPVAEGPITRSEPQQGTLFDD